MSHLSNRFLNICFTVFPPYRTVKKSTQTSLSFTRSTKHEYKVRLNAMADMICYVLYSTCAAEQRNTFRNIPKWNFAFATRCASRLTGLQKQEAKLKRAGASAPLDLDILKIRSEAARLRSATCAIDRSISHRRGSRRQTLIITRYFYLSMRESRIVIA